MRKLVLLVAAVLSLLQNVSADVIVRYKSEMIRAQSTVFKVNGAYNISGNKNFSEFTTNISMPDEVGTPLNIISRRIYLLDKGICWSLFANNKYSESTVKALHDSVGQATNYSWTYDISPIAGNKKINEFQCLGQIGKAVGINTDDPADTVYLTFEQWSAEDTLHAREFILYQNNYSRVGGVHKIWAQDHLATFLEKGYGAQFERLSDLMEGRLGIPIMTYIQIERSILYDQSKSTGRSARRGEAMRPKDGGYWKIGEMKNEVISIEEKKIGDSVFEIPVNYVKK